MRVLLQRVSRAKVLVDGQITGQIGQGILVFIGVGKEDGNPQIQWMAEKILNLRIFDDAFGKVNLSLLDRGKPLGGEPIYPLWGMQKR